MARQSRAGAGEIEVEALIERARRGEHGPVHLIVGPERFLAERAIGLLKRAALGDGPPGFNDDLFHGQSLVAQRLLSTARTLPMMASSRFVLARGVEKAKPSELDALAPYLADPSPSTCLVLTAEKLDGRSKFVKAAKKANIWVDAKELKGGAQRQFAQAEAERRGHTLRPRAAEALIEAVGGDLAALDDAIERLSLFVGRDARGEGAPIDASAVEACVTRIRVDSIWALVDAVSLRDTRRALGAAGSLLADREPPLRILAMIARQLRMVARMRQALASGLRGQEAAREAGAPPFKARDLTESARRFKARDLALAFAVLAEADLALKGSRTPPDAVLEEALLRLCAGRPLGYRLPVRRRRR